MGLLLEHKWFLLVANEALFWALLALFLVARYVLGLGRASLVFLALFTADIAVLAALAILAYVRTGEFGAFGTVAVALIFYALIWGVEDFRKLDAYLKRKVAAHRGEATTVATQRKTTPDTAREAGKERRGFYAHVALFAAGQLLLLAMGESWLAALPAGDVPEGPSALMSAGRVWCVVLIVDGLWSLSYAVFPGREGAR